MCSEASGCFCGVITVDRSNVYVAHQSRNTGGVICEALLLLLSTIGNILEQIGENLMLCLIISAVEMEMILSRVCISKFFVYFHWKHYSNGYRLNWGSLTKHVHQNSDIYIYNNQFITKLINVLMVLQKFFILLWPGEVFESAWQKQNIRESYNFQIDI